MKETGPFRFYTERRLVLMTGHRAATLEELTEFVGKVSGSCIFYHTHHQFLSHHYERPVFLNDFSLWVRRALQQPKLGERLAAIDLLGATTVRQVREQILSALQEALREGVDGQRSAPPDDLFHFCESQSFVMNTAIVAHDPKEFFRLLPQVSTISLFFHFFEARLRLGRPSNDFSLWLDCMGCQKAARRIDALNPYLITLEELRQQIVRIGQEEVLS